MTNPIENPDRLLTCVEAAKYLNISKSSMDRLRLDGYVPYVKIGKRKIRYKESDLKELIEKFTFRKVKYNRRFVVKVL